jgi:hypothetical protein
MEKSTELQSPDSESTTLALDEKAPVLNRLTSAMEFLIKDVMDNDRTSKKAKFMFSKLWQEAMAELEECPPEIIEEQFSRTTALMHWVATGEVIQNIPMPEGFWDHAGVVPEIPASKPLALEAGVGVE